MRTTLSVLFALMIIILSSCVSSTEHEARLHDISPLESTLKEEEERAKNIENSLALLQNEHNKLSDDLQALKKQRSELEDLISEKDVRIRRLDEELNLRDLRITGLNEEVDRLYKEKEIAIKEKNDEIAGLKQTHDEFVGQLHDEIVRGEIQITQLKGNLTVQMVDKILFDSGRAVVKKDGESVLDSVAEILKKVTGKQFRVEGHTDNVPISARLAERFPSNWELSVARAINVVRYLQEAGGIDPSVLSAAGYGEHRPIASNDTEEGRSKNRRIEIVLAPLDDTEDNDPSVSE
ncbi:MAG: OmpA family protein [Nitrospirota bacterium]|nr:MAG: OmpA family protein [Nitrospirota bacterium]